MVAGAPSHLTPGLRKALNFSEQVTPKASLLEWLQAPG